MTQDLVKPEQAGTLTMPGTGQAFDLTKLDDVLAAGHALTELRRQTDAAKDKVNAVTRFHLRTGALTYIDRGRYSATEKTGKAEYNAQAIYDAAIAAGIPQDAVERMIPLERKVSSGTELNKLATRDDRWAKAIASGTNRKPGSLSYDLKEQAAQAPATPESVKHAVAAESRAERELEDLGI